MFNICVHVDDLITLEELKSDHNPILLKVDNMMTAQIDIRWDEFRQ